MHMYAILFLYLIRIEWCCVLGVIPQDYLVCFVCLMVPVVIMPPNLPRKTLCIT